MTNSKNASSQPLVSGGKLGRGLGRLIPVKQQESGHLGTVSVEGEGVSGVGSVVTPKSPTSIAEQVARPTQTGATGATGVAQLQASGTKQPIERQVALIQIDAIATNARQPRQEFNQKSIEELADSIRSAGLLQPIIVRPVHGSKDRYELVAGERRWRACKHIGWKEIPAIVTQASDQNAGIWALIENVHRTDLNAMDRAIALKRLVSEFRLTHETLAEQIALDRSSVTNLLRLSELDEVTAGLVRKGQLSQGHAKALLGIQNEKTRATVAETAVRGDWSVRTLEREVQRLAESNVPRGTVATRKRANIDALERKLSQALGTEVTIQTGRKPNTGKLQIAFYSIEQFEGILTAIGVKHGQIRLDD